MRNLKELTELLTKTFGDAKRAGGNALTDLNSVGLDVTSPVERNARDFLSKDETNVAIQDLTRKAQLGSKSGPVQDNLVVGIAEPKFDSNKRITNLNDMATNAMDPGTGKYKMLINPNADEVFAAHELGHIINRQGNLGKLVRDLRDNPALTKALAAAGAAGGFGYALGNEGNDDIDDAVIMSLVGSAPMLIDEAGASIKALDLMNRAGSRASLGQRGRLAGGYMTYLAPALLTGLGAAGVGNMLD